MIRRPSFSFSRSAFLLAVLLHHQALFWQQGLCHATRTTPYADASIIEHSIKEVERNTAAVVMTMGVRDRQQMITPGAMIMGVPDKYRTKYLPMTSGSNTGTASATTSHVIASPSTSPPTITTPTPTASVSLPTEYASPESTSSYYTAAAEEGTIMMRMMKKRDMMSQMRMGKRPNDGKSSKSNNDMKTMKSEKREYDDETKGYYLHAPVPAHQGGTNTQPVGVRGRARSRGMAMSSTKSRPSKSSHSETARRMRNSLKDGGMMSSKNKSSKKRQNGLPPKGWETPVEVVHPPQMKVRQMRYSLGGKAGSKSKGLSSSSSSSSTKQSAKTSPSKKDLPPIQRRRYHGQKESTTKSSMSKSKGSSGSGMKMHWRYSMGKGKGKGFTRRPPTPSASPTPTFYPVPIEAPIETGPANSDPTQTISTSPTSAPRSAETTSGVPKPTFPASNNQSPPPSLNAFKSISSEPTLVSTPESGPASFPTMPPTIGPMHFNSPTTGPGPGYLPAPTPYPTAHSGLGAQPALDPAPVEPTSPASPEASPSFTSSPIGVPTQGSTAVLSTSPTLPPNPFLTSAPQVYSGSANIESSAPSIVPTTAQAISPTSAPTQSAITAKTQAPTPEDIPLKVPPTDIPSVLQSERPSPAPTLEEIGDFSDGSTSSPVVVKLPIPSTIFSKAPIVVTSSLAPSVSPSFSTSKMPSSVPSQRFASDSSLSPTAIPTSEVTSAFPSELPSEIPSELPSEMPSMLPSTFGECVLLDSLEEIWSAEEVDLLGDGISPGDVYVFGGNDLYAGDRLVGESRGRCVLLEDLTVADNLYCTREFTFSNGSTVKVQGVLFEQVVVGGTGCYLGIQGGFAYGRESTGFSYEFFPEDSTEGCVNEQGVTASPWSEVGGRTAIDWDSNTLSPGDVYVFDGNEFVTPSGINGFLEGECMILQDASDPNKSFCTMTFLTNTTEINILTVQGVFDNMVITSGVGCFYGATGTISGSLFNQSAEYSLNFDAPDSASDESCPSITIFDELWEEPFGDFLVDYNGDGGAFGGDGYLFDNKVVTIPSTGQTASGAGRCLFLDTSGTIYCSIIYTLEEGTIAAQGYFDDMAIVGATGCFRGLEGTVSASETETGFFYTWSIVATE